MFYYYTVPFENNNSQERFTIAYSCCYKHDNYDDMFLKYNNKYVECVLRINYYPHLKMK